MIRYIFRFDGSHDNDEYLNLARGRGFALFAGTELRVGSGWIPDCMRVTLSADGSSCELAIIELEASENAARISARKYLPESSRGIVLAFLAYLDRVAAQCRSTADPRLDGVVSVRLGIATCERVVLVTAGVLRDRFDPVEELPLTDQGIVDLTGVQQDDENDGGGLNDEPSPEFVGSSVLSPKEHKTLSRTILVIDAVVRGWDKSEASYRAWRNSRSQPLRAALREDAVRFPQRSAIVVGHKLGVQIDVERLALELQSLWSGLERELRPDGGVVQAIRTYYPVACACVDRFSRGSFPRSAPLRSA